MGGGSGAIIASWLRVLIVNGDNMSTTKESHATSKGRFFGLVTYLSDPQKVIKMIETKRTSIRSYALIVHDKDQADPHIHIVIRTHNPWTCKQVCNWFVDTETNQNAFAEFVHDRLGIIDYLTHENDPDKHHYDKSEIIDGGIDDLLPKGNTDDLTCEILELLLQGTAIRELVKMYGKDFLYHIRDYTTAVKMICIQTNEELPDIISAVMP